MGVSRWQGRGDETPETALIRELREELGVDTAESCLAPLSFVSHAYDQPAKTAPFHLLMMLYIVSALARTATTA